jgi:hypothetical protein
MKEGYHPKQRSVETNILTPGGWLTGTFHIPETASFPEYLNREADFDTLTDVTIAGSDKPVAFFLLHRNMIQLLVPREKSNAPFPLLPATAETRRIFCLMAGVSITADVQVLKSMRISDFFSRRKGFIVLADCFIRRIDQGVAKEETFPVVLLNPDAIIGITDILT